MYSCRASQVHVWGLTTFLFITFLTKWITAVANQPNMIPTNKNTWNTRVKHVSIGESHVFKTPWITGESVMGGTREIVGISGEQKHVKYSGKTRVDGENLVNKNTWNTRV